MSEELRRMGTLLRQKRQEMNLSLKEVENSTSIRAGYIDAIEEGKISECVSSTYAIGFMKQYATFLGYDAERLVREHPSAFRIAPQKQEFSFGIGTLEARGNASGGMKWLPSLLWTAVGTGVLLLAWFFAKAMGIL